MTPGINVDGEVGYTWIDSDLELEDFGAVRDDYDTLVFGIGTNITF